ncbi:MAG: hypothetical protein IKY23_10420 [Lachnospiraceae bacterium]|nr:hypothetical protein [Lachnospiraceae bacterium]
MIQVKLLNGEIEISSDVNNDSEVSLLKELNQILCFSIVIYKLRLEKLQRKKLTVLDEAVLNQKIKDSIVMIPVDEVRGLIKESDS